jgi:hypothetical protein
VSQAGGRGEGGGGRGEGVKGEGEGEGVARSRGQITSETRAEYIRRLMAGGGGGQPHT